MALKAKVFRIILLAGLMAGGCTNVKEETKTDSQIYTKVSVGVSSGVYYTVLNELNEILEKDGYQITIRQYDTPDELLYAAAAEDVDGAYGLTREEVQGFSQETGIELNIIDTYVFEPLRFYSNPSAAKAADQMDIMFPKGKNKASRAQRLLTSQGIMEEQDKNSATDLADNETVTYRRLPYDPSDFLNLLQQGGGIIVDGTVLLTEEGYFLKDYDFVSEQYAGEADMIVLAVLNKNVETERTKKMKDGFCSEELKRFIRETYLGLIEIVQ